MDDLLWSLYPPAESAALARLRGYHRYRADKGIEDGPALDAGRDGLPVFMDGGVAIVDLMGPMFRRAGSVARRHFGLAGTDATRMAVEAADADPDTEHILLRVDSPGGSVSGLDQLGDAVARTAKPVTAVVDGMAASAAYYVASQADRILLGRTDMVGSIGTRLMLYDFSKMFEQEGVEAVPIDTGPFKSAGAMGTKITEEQRADFQRIVDFYYNDFVGAVARGRNLSEKAVLKVADGRLFTPGEAQSLGLVDGIATIAEVRHELRSRMSRRGRKTDAARARLLL